MIVYHSKDKKYHTSVSHSIKTVVLDSRVRIFNLNTFQYLQAGKPFCFRSKLTAKNYETAVISASGK